MSEPRKRFTTVHSRYQVCCSCCGSVEHVAKKNEAIQRMKYHIKSHPSSDTITTCVYDLMHRGGGRIVFGGDIQYGLRGWGIGIGYDARTGKSTVRY